MNDIYLIKDLAHTAGYSIHTLKYYLKIGLIKELGKTPETNFRYFNNETVKMLLQIRDLRRQGKSIKEIKRLVGQA